jgi:hypothetical protein
MAGRFAAGRAGDHQIVFAGCAGAAVLGLTAALGGLAAVPVVAALIVLGVCAYRPVAATYLYLATMPFLAGIDRGAIPLRANEAVLLLVLTGAGAGAYVRYLRGAPVSLRLRPAVDVPLAAFVLLSTIWPLASMLLRATTPQASDLLAVLPVCKLTALLLLVRTTVVEPAQLVRLIRIVAWTATAIAAIAILQTLGVGPVVHLLGAISPGEQTSELTARGSTTLASSIATGDVIIIGLTLVIASGMNGVLGRRERLVAGFVLGAGALAAGQFSTWISALVAAVLLLHLFPALRRRAVPFLPVVALAVLIGAPAFIARVASFGEGFGVPRSWLGRWDNLSHFYIPRLFPDFQFLIGVSPDSVLPAPETWREVIFLESGYLELLWVGGIPLLLGFAWLSVAVLRRTRALVGRVGPVGACAATLQVAWATVIVLSVIDPHIFLRGTGDLLFALLGVVTGTVANASASAAVSDHPQA